MDPRRRPRRGGGHFGYGVGSALIRASLALASDIGSDVFWVRAQARNRGACSFFLRWDFSLVGRTSLKLAGGGKRRAPLDSVEIDRLPGRSE